MKSSKKDIVKTIIFVIFLGVLFCFVTSFFDRRLDEKNWEFNNEQKEFDVLFFGSCHPQIAVSPMELWNNYGIVSYNLGNGSENVKVSYLVMKNALKIKKPKLVIFDVSAFLVKDSSIDEKSLAHQGLDSFPLSKNKIETINELNISRDEKVEFYFTIGNKHSRWEEINIEDFTKNSKYMKGQLSYGFFRTMKVVPYEQYPLVDGIADYDLEHTDVIYLNKIISLCKEEGIELLFINIPYICPEYRQEYAHAAAYIAKENEIPFVNLLETENPVIDMTIDTYDGQHVNQSGMKKITKYIGDYLVDNYHFEDHRADKAYADWETKYDDYKTLKLESLWWSDEFDSVLMMLHDEDLKSYIYLHSGEEAFYTEVRQKLVDNVINADFVMKDQAKKQVEEYVDNVDIFNDADAIIIIEDNETNCVKLIKKYIVDGETIREENIYSSVKPKYLFN